MSILSDNIYIKTLGASAAVVTALAIKYPDRALFDESRPDIAHKKGWPILGVLPSLLYNAERMHEFLLLGFTNLGSLTT
jgi:fatty acid omega-hydroxylase